MGMPAAQRVASAAALELVLERSRSEPGQFLREAMKPVFAPSGRQKRTEPGQPAWQSVFGVLQLAYFSMRYGLPSGFRPRAFYQKSYPAVSFGSTRKSNRSRYVRHPAKWLLAGLLLRRRKSHKGLIGRPIRLCPTGSRFSGPVHKPRSPRRSPSRAVLAQAPAPPGPRLDPFERAAIVPAQNDAANATGT